MKEIKVYRTLGGYVGYGDSKRFAPFGKDRVCIVNLSRVTTGLDGWALIKVKPEYHKLILTVRLKENSGIISPTEEENEIITKAAESDEDSIPYSEEEWEYVRNNCGVFK